MLGNKAEDSLHGKIVVVDLSYLMHRSYKASQSSRSTTEIMGEASSTVPMTISTLKRILKPREIHFAIEAGHDHRDAINPLYKDRADKDPELVREIELIIRDLINNNESVIYAMGLEADDVMATMAWDHGKDCILVTADKDMHQLIDMCHIYHPYDKRETTRDDVTKKWGIEPHLLGDMLALNGDTADNIPGIEGVGPKTAAGLLKEYGNLQGILDRSDEMAARKRPKKIWQRLSANKQSALDSRSLVQLVIDAKIETATHQSILEIHNRNRDELVTESTEDQNERHETSAGIPERQPEVDGDSDCEWF